MHAAARLFWRYLVEKMPVGLFCMGVWANSGKCLVGRAAIGASVGQGFGVSWAARICGMARFLLAYKGCIWRFGLIVRLIAVCYNNLRCPSLRHTTW
jgi:hypothetical protein